MPDGPDSGLGDLTALLEPCHASLIVVIRQAAAEHMDELCWDLALTAVTLFEAKGYFDEWLDSARIALEATRHRGNRRGEAAMQYSLGSLYLAEMKPDQAESFLSAALHMFRSLDDTHGCALVQRNLAHVDWLHGNTDVMLARYEEALAMSRSVGDLIAVAHILTNLAKFRIGAGDHDQAKQMLDEALAICHEVRCARVEAQVLYRFADLHLSCDDIASAREAVHRTLRTVRDLGDRIGEAYALYTLGIVRHREGRLDNAHHPRARADTGHPARRTMDRGAGTVHARRGRTGQEQRERRRGLPAFGERSVQRAGFGDVASQVPRLAVRSAHCAG